jgi:hypothetical protein
MTYKIIEGKDHFKNIPLFKVIGIYNDYAGEWHKTREEAKQELNTLKS